MSFYKNSKNLYFCDDPRFIIVKGYGVWAVCIATDKPGNFVRVSAHHYLKDAKRDVTARATA